MPISMPKNAFITIQKRHLPYNFQMPQMEIAEHHFSLGYIVSGDRRIITPYAQYDAHSGDITAIPPMLYHRTFSTGRDPYINYLVKLSEAFAENFLREIGTDVWNFIFERRHFTFNRDISSRIEDIFEDMLEIYEQSAAYSDTLLKGTVYRLLVMIKDNNTADDVRGFKKKLSKEIIEAMYYIENHYNEGIKLSDAASAVGFSEGHFSRLFSSNVGVPFSTYLINVRLRHAKELLLNTDSSISEVAMETGFGSGDYLSSCFNKYEKMTPSRFRRGNPRSEQD